MQARNERACVERNLSQLTSLFFVFCSPLVWNFMDALGPSRGFPFHMRIRIFIILGLQCTALRDSNILQVWESLMSILQLSALTFPLCPLFTRSSAHRRTGLYWTADSWGHSKEPPPQKSALPQSGKLLFSQNTACWSIRRTPIGGLNCQSVLCSSEPTKINTALTTGMSPAASSQLSVYPLSVLCWVLYSDRTPPRLGEHRGYIQEHVSKCWGRFPSFPPQPQSFIFHFLPADVFPLWLLDLSFSSVLYISPTMPSSPWKSRHTLPVSPVVSHSRAGFLISSQTVELLVLNCSDYQTWQIESIIHFPISAEGS